ncbi:MAG: hypothetical protein CL844_03545 [Crocinitomicaceae bacterium]|nr:hypothetical protein [Crocinitomicaceae bacterium]
MPLGPELATVDPGLAAQPRFATADTDRHGRHRAQGSRAQVLPEGVEGRDGARPLAHQHAQRRQPEQAGHGHPVGRGEQVAALPAEARGAVRRQGQQAAVAETPPDRQGDEVARQPRALGQHAQGDGLGRGRGRRRAAARRLLHAAHGAHQGARGPQVPAAPDLHRRRRDGDGGGVHLLHAGALPHGDGHADHGRQAQEGDGQGLPAGGGDRQPQPGGGHELRAAQRHRLPQAGQGHQEGQEGRREEGQLSRGRRGARWGCLFVCFFV